MVINCQRTNSYTLRMSHIPPFVTGTEASDIFVIGDSLSQLRHVLRNNQSQQEGNDSFDLNSWSGIQDEMIKRDAGQLSKIDLPIQQHVLSQILCEIKSSDKSKLKDSRLGSL